MPDTLKIAACQYPIGEPASLGAWRDKIARWVAEATASDITAQHITLGVTDVDGRAVALFRDEYELRRAVRDNPSWTFADTAPIRPVTEK